MRTSVLQPWVTVQGSATAVTDVIQDESEWLDLSDCADISVWVDVRSVSSVTGTSASAITLVLESSPTKDEDFFAPVAKIPILTASSTPVVMKSVSGAASANPAARWLRWHLMSVPTSTSGFWDATFRIRIARSRTPYFTPARVPGCALWLRSDLGIKLASTALGLTVGTWVDQMGNSGNNLAATDGQCPLTADQFSVFPGVTLGNQGAAYLLASGGVTVTQPSTLIVVAFAAASGAGLQTFAYGGGASPVSLDMTASSSTSVTVNAGAAVAVPVGSALTSASILQVDWNGASTQVYQNGTAQGGVVNAGANALTFTSLGATSADANVLGGQVAEVLIFKPALTASWRTLVTRYLGNRYAITVP